MFEYNSIFVFNHRYRQRRSYSTRSETNDSVFKDGEVTKHSVSKQSSHAMKDTKTKHKRAKSTSSQQQSSSSTNGHNNQNDKKERRSTSKKPNKRRTKSESAKNVTSPENTNISKNSNGVQTVSPLNDTLKNKRRSRPKPRQRVPSVDIDHQSILQSNTKPNGNNKRNSRSNSRVTRRDFIDRQDFGREISTGRQPHREYTQSPKKYYSQSRHNSYSQDRSVYGTIRSNSRVHQRDSNRPVIMQQNRYSNGPIVRQTRYFNGPMVRHSSFNDPAIRPHVGGNNVIRHNSYTNDQYPRQNNNYEGVISRRNSFSKTNTRQDGYINSRVYRPPQYNVMASHTDEVNLTFCNKCVIF